MFPIKYIDNNLVWNKDNEVFAYYETMANLYIYRNTIISYPNCKSVIDVARQKLMNDPTFKHLSEDCQEYYFDFEAYASHLQEHGKFLVTEHGIFELPE